MTNSLSCQKSYLKVCDDWFFFKYHLSFKKFWVKTSLFALKLQLLVFLQLTGPCRNWKQKKSDCNFEHVFELESDIKSMISVSTVSKPIIFDLGLNKVLVFKNTHYSDRTQKSEQPVLGPSIDKMHLACDCVIGSIVDGIREQILCSFSVNALQGYKIIKEPTTVLHKTRFDTIQLFLENSNHNMVNFNKFWTFTIQIKNI